MNGLWLEVFYHTENSELLEGLGIEAPLTDYEKRVLVFYNINLLSPYTDPKDPTKEYVKVHANGDTFICNMSIRDLADIINQNNRLS